MLDGEREQSADTLSLLSVDSQSVKLNLMLEKDRGIDGNKKVNGRKRQFLVDTDGRLWGVAVYTVNTADGKGGLTLLDNMEAFKERLEKFFGDTSSYNLQWYFCSKSERKRVFI